jgi:sulfur-carrier protein
MKVLIPSPLLSYTRQKEVAANGTTLGQVLFDLDRQFPGLRFRVVDEQEQLRELAHALGPADSVQLVQALSGG